MRVRSLIAAAVVKVANICMYAGVTSTATPCDKRDMSRQRTVY